TATNTATAVPPTATNTPTATATDTATAVPPTATNTPTATATDTATATATDTATAVPPTATNAPTATATDTATATATDTATSVPPTATNTPTATSTATATATATRTPTGSLTIVKAATPADGTDFVFTSNIPGGSSFTLDVDSDSTYSDTITFNNLAVGSYAITETVADDWQLDSASCTGGSDGGNLSGETLTVALDANEAVTCTFVNSFNPPPTDVNALLNLDSAQTNYNHTSAPNAPAGIYTITATFRNISTATLKDVYFEVAQLSNNNLLLNADGGPGGPGAILSVPPASLGPDAVLSPNETFTLGFEIGLASAKPFNFLVDAYGVVVDDVSITSVTKVGSFRFEIDPAASPAQDGHTYYLPMIVK
ncbi:MAG: hypothetical protein KDJ52_25740, partial [Anaerolineae bacterium]|nr:hypothetical protein [Anaerolineae bacterium]